MELKMDELLELIREQVELVEEQNGKSAGLESWLPQMRITDQWGKGKPSPGVIDKVVELIVSEGSSKDLVGGLVALDNLYRTIEKKATPQKAFAGILFLEVLSAAVEDFNKDTRGLLFESILAKLIRSETTDDKQIIDIVGKEGRGYQLKTRQDKITGSRKLLLDRVLGENKPVIFVVGHVEGDSLTFQKFEINQDNVGELAGNVEVGGEGEEKKKTPAVELYNNEDQPKLGRFTKTISTLTPDLGSEIIATLPVKGTAYEEKAKELIAKLEKGLVPLYENLKEITDNANEYFLGKEEGRDTAATKLIDASRRLPQAAEEAIVLNNDSMEE
jgi:hypothetical protein